MIRLARPLKPINCTAGGVGEYFRCDMLLAELHSDLFSRHACPFEGFSFCGGERNNRDRRKTTRRDGLVLAVTIMTNAPSPTGPSVQQRGFQ